MNEFNFPSAECLDLAPSHGQLLIIVTMARQLGAPKEISVMVGFERSTQKMKFKLIFCLLSVSREVFSSEPGRATAKVCV